MERELYPSLSSYYIFDLRIRMQEKTTELKGAFVVSIYSLLMIKRKRVGGGGRGDDEIAPQTTFSTFFPYLSIRA
jgi:hypothetical protein